MPNIYAVLQKCHNLRFGYQLVIAFTSSFHADLASRESAKYERNANNKVGRLLVSIFGLTTEHPNIFYLPLVANPRLIEEGAREW